MRISVIVPVYNTDRIYLRKSVAAIFNQSYKPYEVIIVNDGSDRTETIATLDELKNEFGSLIIIDQENKGIPGALNTGIRYMTGNWWAGCGSDDLWFKDKLKTQIDFINKNPIIEIVYCDWYFINENDSIIRRYNEPEFKTRADAGKFLIRTYFPNWSGLLISKSVFDNVGLYNEKFLTREDYEMSIRILKKYMMYHVSMALFGYRLHRKQISNSDDFGTRTIQSKKFCEMARDLAIDNFGDENDRKEFPLDRKI